MPQMGNHVRSMRFDGPVMFHDVGPWRQRGEEGVAVVPRKHLVNRPHGCRKTLAVLIETLVVQVQVKHIPSTTVHALGSNAIRSSLPVGTDGVPIGLEATETRDTVTAGSDELLANLFKMAFNCLEPRKRLIRPDVMTPKAWHILGRVAHERKSMCPDAPIELQQPPLS